MDFSITTVLIAVTCLFSFYAWQSPNNMGKYIMNPGMITSRKEYYRFISSGFIHADTMHLFFNMFTLYSFGRYLEYSYINQYDNRIGGALYLCLYLLGIVFSDYPSYSKNKNNYQYNSLGASGGVSAVLFACILLNPWMTIGVYFIPVPAIIFAGLYIAYSIYMGKQNRDNVNHSAHLYGALFGVAFMILTYPGALSGFLNELLNRS